jgi:hypothetical protein
MQRVALLQISRQNVVFAEGIIGEAFFFVMVKNADVVYIRLSLHH